MTAPFLTQEDLSEISRISGRTPELALLYLTEPSYHSRFRVSELKFILTLLRNKALRRHDPHSPYHSLTRVNLYVNKPELLTQLRTCFQLPHMLPMSAPRPVALAKTPADKPPAAPKISAALWASDALSHQRGPFSRSIKILGLSSAPSPGHGGYHSTVRFHWDPAQGLPVHLYMYSMEDKKLVAFDQHKVSSGFGTASNPPRSQKKKGKFSVTVLPVDLSSLVRPGPNLITVSGMRHKTVLVAELAAQVSNSEFMQQVGRRPLPVGVSPFYRPCCAVCRDTDDVRRCSQCKTVYYCSIQHQSEHWAVHSMECVADQADTPVQVADASIQLMYQGATEDDDDIQEAFADISLKCPLLVDRIGVPGKGTACTHLQCFDLETYLDLCRQSCSWQCPICSCSLPAEQLYVDRIFADLLKEAGEDVESVRIFPDGKQEYLQQKHSDRDRVGSSESDSDEDDGPRVKRAKPNDLYPGGLTPLGTSFDDAIVLE